MGPTGELERSPLWLGSHDVRRGQLQLVCEDTGEARWHECLHKPTRMMELVILIYIPNVKIIGNLKFFEQINLSLELDLFRVTL